MANYDDGADADKTPVNDKKADASPPAGGGQGGSPPDNSQTKKHTLNDGSVPPELRYIGLALSSVMILGGFYAVLYSSKLYGIAILLICVGFGIMLAAFGAQAEGRIFKFNVVGG